MVFSGDAQRWAGLFSYKGEDPNTGRFWTGTSAAATRGRVRTGRRHRAADDRGHRGVRTGARLRINFDSDSDRIRDESRPVLDQVAAMLKARPQWKITVEGHTDSTASSQHNQELSERRANAVRQHLEGAAIAASR